MISRVSRSAVLPEKFVAKGLYNNNELYLRVKSSSPGALIKIIEDVEIKSIYLKSNQTLAFDETGKQSRVLTPHITPSLGIEAWPH